MGGVVYMHFIGEFWPKKNVFKLMRRSTNMSVAFNYNTIDI